MALLTAFYKEMSTYNRPCLRGAGGGGGIFCKQSQLLSEDDGCYPQRIVFYRKGATQVCVLGKVSPSHGAFKKVTKQKVTVGRGTRTLESSFVPNLLC